VKNKIILAFLIAITCAASAVEKKEIEKRESFFKNCLETTIDGIQEAEQFKKYASKPFLLFAMSSCYCGRVASKFDPKDAEEMVQKLKNKEKFDKKPKMLELYESSEAACKKALLD
jgi:hypothetical protein